MCEQPVELQRGLAEVRFGEYRRFIGFGAQYRSRSGPPQHCPRVMPSTVCGNVLLPGSACLYDFNDLIIEEGADAVRKRVNASMQVALNIVFCRLQEAQDATRRTPVA